MHVPQVTSEAFFRRLCGSRISSSLPMPWIISNLCIKLN